MWVTFFACFEVGPSLESPRCLYGPKGKFSQQNINIRVGVRAPIPSHFLLLTESFILLLRASILNVNMANTEQGTFEGRPPILPSPPRGGILRNSFDTVISYLRYNGRVYKKSEQRQLVWINEGILTTFHWNDTGHKRKWKQFFSRHRLK